MQCAKFEQRLQQVLDDRQSAEQDRWLVAHARGCRECNTVLRLQSQLFAELSSPVEQDRRHEIGHRILDQVRIAQRKRTNRRVWMAAFAAAAAILLALLPLAGQRVRSPQKLDSNPGQLALAAPAPRPVPATSLTKQESEDLRMLMRQLMLRLSDQRLEMFEPVEQLANGIRPIAVTFNLALDTLRRTLPGYSPSHPTEPQARQQGLWSPIS